MLSIMSNFKKLIGSALAITFVASTLVFSSGAANASPEGRDFVLGLGAIIVDKMIEAEERKNGGGEEDYEADKNDRYPENDENQDEEYNEDDPQDDQY